MFSCLFVCLFVCLVGFFVWFFLGGGGCPTNIYKKGLLFKKGVFSLHTVGCMIFSSHGHLLKAYRIILGKYDKNRIVCMLFVQLLTKMTTKLQIHDAFNHWTKVTARFSVIVFNIKTIVMRLYLFVWPNLYLLLVI